MARGDKKPMPQKEAAPQIKASAPDQPKLAPPQKAQHRPGLETRLSRTTMNHIYAFDIKGDGMLREVAVVKMVKHPETKAVLSVYYIDVALLDNVDKGRLKTIVTGTHADKYELWDLMSQTTLNNGKNALDYFHQLTRAEHSAGAMVGPMGSGLANVRAEGNEMVGAGFTDPGSGALETQPVLGLGGGR